MMRWFLCFVLCPISVPSFLVFFQHHTVVTVGMGVKKNHKFASQERVVGPVFLQPIGMVKFGMVNHLFYQYHKVIRCYKADIEDI